VNRRRIFQIVEEEVAVGWRTVQKAHVSVAAKWKVRPVKVQAVRAHHNFRSDRFVPRLEALNYS
jgi:hypothetical protein